MTSNPKYENFDNNMKRLKAIEEELKTMSSNNEALSLNKIMSLKDEATELHKLCSEVLAEISKK